MHAEAILLTSTRQEVPTDKVEHMLFSFLFFFFCVWPWTRCGLVLGRGGGGKKAWHYVHGYYRSDASMQKEEVQA